MKPKDETTGRSLGRASAAFAASWSPGRKRSRSTELGAPVLAAVRERRAEVPHDGERLAPREPGRGDERRVVEVHELEAVPPEGPAEAEHVVREEAELAQEEEPATAAVGRGPDVREASDGAGVDVRAGLAEELGRRAG